MPANKVVRKPTSFVIFETNGVVTSAASPYVAMFRPFSVADTPRRSISNARRGMDRLMAKPTTDMVAIAAKMLRVCPVDMRKVCRSLGHKNSLFDVSLRGPQAEVCQNACL